jgi:arginyl-tRNA synthetase
MKQDLEQIIADVVKDLFAVDTHVELTRPEEQFGDYATNVALQLGQQVGKNPREIGETLATKLRVAVAEQVSDISIAGPGFLNLKLHDSVLASAAKSKPARSLEGKVIVAEYSDPNPFKVLHAGHLYTSIVGDAIANLLESAGGTVHRVNFGGDVGLHVGKTMWAIFHEAPGHTMSEEDAWGNIQDMKHDSLHSRARWMAARYTAGNDAYEDDAAAKQETVTLNKRVYQIHADNDQQSLFAQIYWTCREWSYEYFKSFYADIDIHEFERFYPESDTAPLGVKVVNEQLAKGVYEKSDGAIVFRGEPYGLHTRVFINSHGLPTYEAKDVGLSIKKWEDYSFDTSVIITGNDIVEYMKVVLKSIEQFAPELANRTKHLTHGQVKLQGGVKMSSRKGNVLLADDILEAANTAAKLLSGEASRTTSLAAVKYAFLKNRIGGDVIYEPEESVALEGNSGPYLQYAHARARSVLAKAVMSASELSDLQPDERSLLRKISEYPEVVEKAVGELMPHHICTYLYELAQVFNRFYEHNRVIDDPRQIVRLQLVALYADKLNSGLTLLGIVAPERM